MNRLGILLGSLIVITLFWPSFVLAADHLVISQVQITGGPGLTTNDFVELYNPTDSDIDLNGMRLVKRTEIGATDTPIKAWSTPAIISAHGYYLWANSSYSGITVTPDATTTASIADNNAVALRSGPNNTGTVIDSVAWGTAVNAFIEGSVFAANPAANQSLERNGADTDNNAADFFLQTTAHPRNSQSPANQVILPPADAATSTASVLAPLPTLSPPSAEFNLELSEIMPNPKGADSGNEWVEFYNPGNSALDLSGWIIDDDMDSGAPSKNSFTVPGTALLPAKDYLVITIPKGKFSLNNSGSDAILVFDRGKVLYESVPYQGPVKDDYVYALDETRTWQWTAQATPGGANSFPETLSYPRTLVISELLANPSDDEEEGEFIEIFNTGEDSVDMAGWTIADKSKRYVISEDDLLNTEILPGGFLVLFREVTGISLNNSGEEEVSLLDPAGEAVSKVSYIGFKEDLSYALESGNIYKWTNIITAGSKNRFSDIAPEIPKENKKVIAKPENTAPREVKLSEIRAEPIGAQIATAGVVSVPPGVFADNIFYLAGSGIKIELRNMSDNSLRIGDSLKLTGKLEEKYRELQLTVNAQDLAVLDSDGVITAHEVKTGEIGEIWEGSLVKFAGQVTDNQGDTFFVDDGSGSARILIRQETGIVKPQIRKDDLVQITGIVSQYNDNYRVLPRFQSDLILQAAGTVAGESAVSLPRTGASFWLILAVASGIWYIYCIIRVLIRKDFINEQSGTCRSHGSKDWYDPR